MKTTVNLNSPQASVSTQNRSNHLSHWLMPGLIAGAVYLLSAMGVGAFTATAWAMPEGIAQAVGINAPVDYRFALVPFLVGVVVHLAVSVGLGPIFTVIARWLRLHGWVLVVAGVIFSAVEPAIAIWGVLHTVLPTTTFWFFLTALPIWASILCHCIYGLVLGLLLAFGPFAAPWIPQRPHVQH